MGNVASFMSEVLLPVMSALTMIFGKPPEKPPAFQPPDEEEAKEVLLKKAREKLKIDTQGKYNFAIAGCSGSGKSTLINVLRGLKPPPRDGRPPRGWAKEGGKECTTEITSYPFADTSVVLWDVPGGDTDSFPAETYFKDQCLYAFDAILVVYHNRLMSSCTNIAQGCHDWNVPVAFVRNKADADIDEDECGDEQEKELRQAMEDQVTEKAGTKGQFARKFLLSAKNIRKGGDRNQFDFGELLKFVVKCGEQRCEE